MITAREIAYLWIIAFFGVALIIWDHRTQMQAILGKIGAGAETFPPEIERGPSVNQTTNNAVPLTGNEFGFLQTFGNVVSGDAQTNGVDVVFGDIWNNLMGQF
jgi:hypothetical protein